MAVEVRPAGLCLESEAVRLYMGGDAQNVQGRRLNLTGYRCFSGAYGPKSRFTADEAADVVGLLDSGAFSDDAECRLTPDAALERQLHWESEAERFWKYPWRAEAVVSYDLLIDEKWANGVRRKERWSVTGADAAVRTTVEAAAYLASQRERLAPRQIVLACQGVDNCQYAECVSGVLRHAESCDVIGLGGWCVLGQFRTWIPQFWATARRVLPMVVAAGITRVHIFGVTFLPVLGPLLWLCDRHGLTLSTDGSGPVLAAVRGEAKRAGARAATWEGNVAWWRSTLAGLRQGVHYREPPAPVLGRQLTMW